METAFHSGLAWNDFAFTKYINTRVSRLLCKFDYEAIQEFPAAMVGKLV